MNRAISALAALAIALVAPRADAQTVRHRRPVAAAPTLNYHFDNNASGGCRDYNCGSRCYDGHSGTDIGVGTGSAVLASADGVVIATNNGCANTGYVGNTCGGRCGNYVQLQHSDGSRTIYCHMQLNSLAVSRSQRVRCGQTLGRSASSGSSSGPHVHFGYRRSASAASSDAFRGRCTSSAGFWTDQNPYPQIPGTPCQCIAAAETCNNRDDDCDGRIDDGLSRACYTGPAGTAGVGICRRGTEACSAGAWAACGGQVRPRAETCNNLDDDCDGRVDEGLSRACYTGTAGTAGIGICRAGMQACGAGMWGVCTGQVLARAETCNGLDDDCDGLVDDACGADAGVVADAGADVTSPPHDVVADASIARDVTVADVGEAPDAGAEEDAAIQRDARVDAEFVDLGPMQPDDDVSPDRTDTPTGCGCRTAGGTGRPTPLLMVLALAAVISTRRRTRPR